MAVTVWVPTACGGVYRPAAVIRPEAAVPPGTPSTRHRTSPLPGPWVVKVWVRVKVSGICRGVTVSPALVSVLADGRAQADWETAAARTREAAKTAVRTRDLSIRSLPPWA